MIRMAAMLQMQRYGFMSSRLQIGNNKLKKLFPPIHTSKSASVEGRKV